MLGRGIGQAGYGLLGRARDGFLGCFHPLCAAVNDAGMVSVKCYHEALVPIVTGNIVQHLNWVRCGRSGICGCCSCCSSCRCCCCCGLRVCRCSVLLVCWLWGISNGLLLVDVVSAVIAVDVVGVGVCWSAVGGCSGRNNLFGEPEIELLFGKPSQFVGLDDVLRGSCGNHQLYNIFTRAAVQHRPRVIRPTEGGDRSRSGRKACTKKKKEIEQMWTKRK